MFQYDPPIEQTDFFQMNFKKRNIPGVDSDSYHQGYFEGKTEHYEVNHREETDLEPLIQSLYIFGILFFSLALLTAIAFSIREYIYSYRNRLKREYINENKLDYYWSSAAGAANVDLENANVIVNKEEEIEEVVKKLNNNSHWPRGTFSPTAKMKNDGEDGSISSWDNNEFKTPMDYEMFELNNRKEEIKYLDVVSIKTTDPSFYNIPGLINDKKIYSIEDLMFMKPKKKEFVVSPRLEIEELDIDPRNSSKIKKWILSPIFNVEPIKFQSTWKANKFLKEISLYLTNDLVRLSDPLETIVPISSHDTVTKKIMIIKLLVFGSNDKFLSNPNIYLSEFNTLMNKLVDTGVFFQLLQDSSPVIINCLVDFLLRYIWCHWQFRTIRHRSIMKQFKLWKLSNPSIQPHHVLFRYLCNIELGIYAVGRLDLQVCKDSENKIISMLNYMTVHTFCNDYINIIPILSQSIEFTERVHSQRLFYGLVEVLVKKHKDCCMKEYLIEDLIDLKPLILHGFWVGNDSMVRKVAENIHLMIVEKYPQTMSWWKEVDGGQKYIEASARFINNDTNKHLEVDSAYKILSFTPNSEDRLNLDRNATLNKIKKESKTESENENAALYEPSVPGSYNF